MNEFWILIVILTLGLIAVAVVFFAPRRSAVCPACGSRSLNCVQWIRTTVLVEGKRAPDSWGYFRCESCSARFKKPLGKDFTETSEAEWNQFCSGNDKTQ